MPISISEDDEFYGEYYRRVFGERQNLKEVIQQIWKICHRPSSQHPKGSHAYTHFMADFDEIRKLCAPFIEE